MFLRRVPTNFQMDRDLIGSGSNSCPNLFAQVSSGSAGPQIRRRSLYGEGKRHRVERSGEKVGKVERTRSHATEHPRSTTHRLDWSEADRVRGTERTNDPDLLEGDRGG